MNVQHDKGFQLAVTRNPRTPQNGQNVHGFQVRTPICHIVPVSRAYVYGGFSTPKPSFPDFGDFGGNSALVIGF